MTVYVVASITRGQIEEVTVFLSPENARKAEWDWLQRAGIKNERDRRRLADQGAGIAVLECPLKP